MPSRLASHYPDVQLALDAVIADEKMQLTTRIVLWAAAEAGLEMATVMFILSKRDPTLFDDLCAEMDEQSFRLFECGDQVHLSFFSKARAYSASAWLARETPHEAIYESIFATEKPFVIADFL